MQVHFTLWQTDRSKDVGGPSFARSYFHAWWGKELGYVSLQLCHDFYSSIIFL